MALSRFRFAWLPLIFSAVFLGADPVPLRTQGTFDIDVKASASEQFAYATSFQPSSGDLSERHLAVLKTVAALEVIPKRWPAERALGIQAYREMIARFAGAQMHRNAVLMCEKALAFAEGPTEELPFIAAKGRSLAWLGQTDEARAAFIQATTGEFHRLSTFDRNAILIDATWFFERDKQSATAARHAHARAKYAAGNLGPAEALRKAVELRFRANDHVSARVILNELTHAAARARQAALSPDEHDVLRRIELSIAEFEKQLGK